MSRDLDDLVPEFREIVDTLLEKCENSGYKMVPYSTIRTPFEQGKLWRQSRSTSMVNQKILDLKSEGADFLAHCIESVGPQSGDPVTNAIPGYSWHQWGEGLDCYWSVDGGAEWSVERTINGKNGYKNYASKAKALGLDAGGYWTSIKDWPHVQLRTEANPGKLYSLLEIDQQMKKEFG